MFLGPAGDDPQSTEVKRLAIRPGDLLVLKVDHYLDDEAVDDLHVRLLEALGPDVKVLVLEPGAEIGVIGPDADGEDVKSPEPTVQLSGGSPGDEFFRWLKAEVRRRGGASAVFT